MHVQKMYANMIKSILEMLQLINLLTCYNFQHCDVVKPEYTVCVCVGVFE